MVRMSNCHWRIGTGACALWRLENRVAVIGPKLPPPNSSCSLSSGSIARSLRLRRSVVVAAKTWLSGSYRWKGRRTEDGGMIRLVVVSSGLAQRELRASRTRHSHRQDLAPAECRPGLHGLLNPYSERSSGKQSKRTPPRKIVRLKPDLLRREILRGRCGYECSIAEHTTSVRASETLRESKWTKSNFLWHSKRTNCRSLREENASETQGVAVGLVCRGLSGRETE